MRRQSESDRRVIAPHSWKNDDEDLGRLVVLELLSTPSRCLFIPHGALTGSGSFPLMRKLIDIYCDEHDVSDGVRASAQSYSNDLLHHALASLFKQRQ